MARVRNLPVLYVPAPALLWSCRSFPSMFAELTLHDYAGLTLHDYAGLTLHDYAGLTLHDYAGLTPHDYYAGLTLHNLRWFDPT